MTDTLKGLAAGRVVFGDRVVRGITDRQAEFLRKLLETKKFDESQIPFNADGSLDLNLKHASRLIDYLLKCPDAVERKATDRQVTYLQSLISRRENGDQFAGLTLESTYDEVSKAIDYMTKQSIKKANLEVGAYRHEGVIYSVRRTQETKTLYAVHWVDGKWSERDYKLVFKIAPESRLTLLEAIQFGAATGCCVHCGRTLTVAKSIQAGMGKVCAAKYH
jgi:hypothetical protein